MTAGARPPPLLDSIAAYGCPPADDSPRVPDAAPFVPAPGWPGGDSRERQQLVDSLRTLTELLAAARAEREDLRHAVIQTRGVLLAVLCEARPLAARHERLREVLRAAEDVLGIPEARRTKT
jgi:hypothetical protein